MSAIVRLEDVRDCEKNIFTVAFHSDVKNAAQAKKKLANAERGSFLTYCIAKKNYCAAVDQTGQITIKPLSWSVAGRWFNGGTGGGSPVSYQTEWDLLAHLVDHQTPIPVIAN